MVAGPQCAPMGARPSRMEGTWILRMPTKPLAQHTQTDALFEALAQLFYDTVAAERVTIEGGCRIMVTLMADLFAMLIHQCADTPEEVEAKIAHLRAPLLAQITTYRQQQAQG